MTLPTVPTGSPMLAVRDLCFRYPQTGTAAAAPLFRGLSMDVLGKGLAVLLGPADAGKTTLGRVIAGLVPRFTGGSLSGTVRLGERDVTRAKPFDLVENVGLVAQDSEEQILTTRCDSEVAFALESLGMPRRQIAERVKESLRIMGLADFRERNPTTLSGGEKKRLMLACCAAIGPGLWILDESLGELDPAWKTSVLDWLAAEGRTVLALDSRLPGLLADRARSFHLLSEGVIAASAERSSDPDFDQALRRSGLLPRGQVSPTNPAAETILRAEGLRFHFPQKDGFSLSIEALELRKGETCALLGSNGSGKSTLGRILCGLLTPQAGRISLGANQSFAAASAGELNSRVGYLFQNPDHQIYLPTVREELALGMRRQGLAGPEIERRVREAAELFALSDLSAPPALMSYGARRRLQAATCFLLHRDLLILDEVDAGLSYGEMEALLAVLSRGGSGLVLITHDVPLARSVSRRILVMDDGRLVGPYEPDRFEAGGERARGAATR